MKKKMFVLIPMLTLSTISCMTVFAKESAESVTEISIEDEKDIDDIYTFTLNGDTYTLPCAVTEFTDNGWNFGNGTLDANTYARTFGYYEDAQENIVFEVANLTDEKDVDLNKLIVVGIQVSQDNIAEDGYEFETTDGIIPGMTTDEIKKVYGEPTYEHETYMEYCFMERYETEGLRSFGNMYAGEDAFTLYMDDEEDRDVVTRVSLEYFGTETEEN